MTEWLSEALLEMYFHRALVDHFSGLYGANFLSLYKPTPHKEAWVGFDQGWTHSELSTKALFQELKKSITRRDKTIQKFYIGYFLQFKPVKKFIRKGSRKPKGYRTPYYRSELSLKPNKTTRISQHETLLRLNAIRNTIVYYACGMLFDQSEIYKYPDLDSLRLIDINTAPTGWATNESHSITFQTPNDPTPLWNSEPIKGKAFSMKDLSSMVDIPHKLKGEEVISLINESIERIRGAHILEQTPLFKTERMEIKYLPDCFTIIKFGPKKMKRQLRHNR